jgi:hypothetical protein
MAPQKVVTPPGRDEESDSEFELPHVRKNATNNLTTKY